jgi:hypothetical protein
MYGFLNQLAPTCGDSSANELVHLDQVFRVYRNGNLGGWHVAMVSPLVILPSSTRFADRQLCRAAELQIR